MNWFIEKSLEIMLFICVLWLMLFGLFGSTMLMIYTIKNWQCLITL